MKFQSLQLNRHPVDMRKAANGLVAIVESEMALDPFTSRLFVFCNRARSIVKIVYWEGNGFAMWMKKLQKSRFQWPVDLPLDVVELNVQQISWLLDGYDLTLSAKATHHCRITPCFSADYDNLTASWISQRLCPLMLMN